ncbi:MAG TPA: YdcF family protein [Bryobacteraceae bacterium]|nr:YdcF family protein [Bryobacteraceae bacterium]
MKKAVLNALALAGSLLVLYVVYISLRIERQSRQDEARHADVILVLGAAEYRGRPSPVLRARLDHAFDLYKRGIAPRIMTTGGAGGDPVYTEGGVGRSYLIGLGVPSEVIIVESEGESTVHSMAAAAEIMRRMGLHSAVAVSDGYHIFRVKRLLQSRGLRVYGSPRPDTPRDTIAERWKYLRQAIGYTLWRLGMPV